MEKLYSIGETAKIMGLSVQTLRNYSNFPFLQPAFINDETGYRFYSFDQFHMIDRIKYLRSFGLSLEEIQEIMMDGKKVDKIVRFLENREIALNKEIEELQMTKQDLHWYLDYFKHLNQTNKNSMPHISHFGTRYILKTECKEGETIEDIEVRLAKMKNEYAIQSGIHFLRQFGYLLQYDQIIDKNWSPDCYFIYVSEKEAAFVKEQIRQADRTKNKTQVFKILPAGDYLCFSFQLRHMDELNTKLIQEYFTNIEFPPYVIANEHEDNLITYTYCPYELQFLLKE